MTLILSGTDGLSDVDGSAATPAIRGTDANTGIFFPAADTIAFSEGGVEAMRIDSSGNVGIGTSSPTTKLTVGSIAAGTLDATYKGNIRIEGTETTIESQGGLEFKMTSDGYGAKIQTLSSGGTNLAFATRNNSATWTERMRIDPSGNVGIGTSSPLGLLNVKGSNGQLVLNNGGSSGGMRLSAFTNAGTANGFLAFEGYSSEYGRFDSSGRLIVGATTTDYKFRVVGFSHFGDAYDAGNYGVIQISREAAQGTQFHLSFVRTGQAVAGMGFLNNSNTLAIQNASTNAGNGVTLTIGATAWGTTSDERKKDVLGQFQDAITKLSNWRTVYFKYKTDESDAPQRIGLMAQDVQATVPEAVSVEEDEIGTLQLRYTELIPVLVKAIQEQQALIQTLTDRITALETPTGTQA